MNFPFPNLHWIQNISNAANLKFMFNVNNVSCLSRWSRAFFAGEKVPCRLKVVGVPHIRNVRNLFNFYVETIYHQHLCWRVQWILTKYANKSMKIEKSEISGLVCRSSEEKWKNLSWLLLGSLSSNWDNYRKTYKSTSLQLNYSNKSKN